MNEMKNAIESNHRWINRRFCETEDRKLELIQLEEIKEKGMKGTYVVHGAIKKKKEVFSKLLVSKRKEREKKAESLFEEVMSENFLNAERSGYPILWSSWVT